MSFQIGCLRRRVIEGLANRTGETVELLYEIGIPTSVPEWRALRLGTDVVELTAAAEENLIVKLGVHVPSIKRDVLALRRSIRENIIIEQFQRIVRNFCWSLDRAAACINFHDLYRVPAVHQAIEEGGTALGVELSVFNQMEEWLLALHSKRWKNIKRVLSAKVRSKLAAVQIPASPDVTDMKAANDSSLLGHASTFFVSGEGAERQLKTFSDVRRSIHELSSTTDSWDAEFSKSWVARVKVATYPIRIAECLLARMTMSRENKSMRRMMFTKFTCNVCDLEENTQLCMTWVELVNHVYSSHYFQARPSGTGN
ncbi:hypothetical protein DFH11DRAFT_784635 [Phellopilus nigrolimitatus]|nr:hypothetical protein DFH11DRAFT_784635 [Phellopilus nigrolimitatus]